MVDETDLALAMRISEEARNTPGSAYAGKCVALLDGRVCAVADDWEGLIDRMRQDAIDTSRVLLFEASIDYTEVQYIGSAC